MCGVPNARAFRIAGVIAALIMGVCAPRLLAQNATVLLHVTVEHVHAIAKAGSNQDVVVWLAPLDGDPPLPAKQGTYRITQRNKQFHPHVMAIPVGNAVQFPNEDPFFHNVFSLYMGKRFDLGLYEAGSSRAVHFDRPGVSFIFCNIHPEMNAYVLALETPYFAVTDAKGDVRIPNVEPGRYRIRVWYERAETNELAQLSRNITISASTVDLGNIGVSESARLIPQHTNKHGRPYEVDRVPYPE
jgi:plastocyanin